LTLIFTSGPGRGSILPAVDRKYRVIGTDPQRLFQVFNDGMDRAAAEAENRTSSRNLWSNGE